MTTRTTTTRTTATTSVDVQPIAGCVGAEIHGVDLTRPLDGETVAEIRAALLQWKVVFFRDQHITQDQHIAFGRRFGEVTPAHPTLPAMFPDHPEILLLDNQLIARGEKGEKGKGKGEAKKDGGKKGGSVLDFESPWHTDVTFVPNPPMGSILRGVVVPDHGGDTQWTNLVAAYEGLSSQVQRLCDELHAVHHNRIAVARGELSPGLKKQFQSQDLQSVHPVVRVHPETGEKAIFVNPGFTDHIVELSRREGSHVLTLLYEQLSDARYTCRFRWHPGSIAFWDNRATCHMVPTDVRPGDHRSMQRITIAGDVPAGPDGSTSYALAGDSFN
jgi:alpha-ketoglutarate-dependent sulfate ester dioxygenase